MMHCYSVSVPFHLIREPEKCSVCLAAGKKILYFFVVRNQCTFPPWSPNSGFRYQKIDTTEALRKKFAKFNFRHWGAWQRTSIPNGILSIANSTTPRCPAEGFGERANVRHFFQTPCLAALLRRQDRKQYGASTELKVHDACRALLALIRTSSSANELLGSFRNLNGLFSLLEAKRSV